MYSMWDLEGFSPNEIVFYREVDEFCKEHYVLKQLDGVIAIYTLDENGNEILQEKTSIATQYLTQSDLDKLEKGIKANGKEELNSILEDYE